MPVGGSQPPSPPPWPLLGPWAVEGQVGLLGMTPCAHPLQLTYLPQPWGNCRTESGLREPELQGYSAYSVSACRLRCEKEAVLQRCHCRMVHMPGGHPTLPPALRAARPGRRTSRGRTLLMCTSKCMCTTTCVRVYTHVSVCVCVWDFLKEIYLFL